MKTQKGERTCVEPPTPVFDSPHDKSLKRPKDSERKKHEVAHKPTPSHHDPVPHKHGYKSATKATPSAKPGSITLADMMLPTPAALEAKADMLLWSVMCKHAVIKSLVKVDARGRVSVMDKRRIESELWKLYDQGLDHMRTDRRLQEHADKVDEASWQKTVVPDIVDRRVFVEHYLKLSSMTLKPECNFLCLKDDWLSKSATQKQVKYQVNVKWQQVQMPEIKQRPFAFKSDCPSEVTDGRRKKSAFETCRTYVKLGSQSLCNFYDYVAGVQSGAVRLTDHLALSTRIEKQRVVLERAYRQPVVVSTDDVEVPILQFRFELKKR